MELPKHFEHKTLEPEIYKRWEEAGFFNPDNLPATEAGERVAPFTIIMPPPNANGSLHIGHALFVSTQDIMIRYKRMQGFKALWLPGMDHAGFETQVVYTKKLEKEGRKFWELPREQLYQEIKDFTLANKAYAESQLKALGASADWSREKFTLDDDIRAVVYETFKMLYDDGLIYRGSRIINWCSKHQTSLSDLEITQPEREDPFYYFKYGPFTIATARPETKFGDKYVIVHPDDKRYAQYQNGQKFEVEWMNGPITATLIKDPMMDMELGTGAMTITPWHSAADFELAQKYNLPVEQIIDWQGKLLPIAGEFAGQHISKAREAIVEKMKAKGLLVKIESRKHAVPVCYKCSTAIEPQVRPQWFVAMTKPSCRIGKSLRDLAVEAINSGEVTFTTDRFKSDFLRWMENLRDWNISRQIVWGIQIPVWYCMACNNPKIGVEPKGQWFVVRHGETDWNVEKKMQGHIDIPLNEVGLEQAKQTAAQFANQKIDLIISSDLQRAKQTADEIAKVTGAEMLTDDRLRERNFGKFQGQKRDESGRIEGLPHDYDTKIEGGESWHEFEDRVMQVITEHKKVHGHKRVVVVTHAGFVRMLTKQLRKLGHDQMMDLPKVGNTSSLKIDILDDCTKCGGNAYEQDPDVFDTWFSSGQWPFATLMANQPGDFENFYPTDVMETGWDILFFWVARMVMFGLYRTGKAPFKTVYLHGLVRDKERQKMSKSKGNVIDPLGVAGEYGTDAVRMALVSGNAAGTDPVISEDKIRGYRNFTTKLWNMAKFLLQYADKFDVNEGVTKRDEEVLHELEGVKKEITSYLDEYKLHLAAESIYHYTWHTVADKLIEEYKPRLAGTDLADKAIAFETLLKVYSECLKMLHPFMPFVTEEIWSKLPAWDGKTMLIVEEW